MEWRGLGCQLIEKHAPIFLNYRNNDLDPDISHRNS